MKIIEKIWDKTWEPMLKILMGALILVVSVALFQYMFIDKSQAQPPAGAWQGCGNTNSGITLADVYNAGFFQRDSSDTVAGKPVFEDTVWLSNSRVQFNPTGKYFEMSGTEYWHVGQIRTSEGNFGTQVYVAGFLQTHKIRNYDQDIEFWINSGNADFTFATVPGSEHFYITNAVFTETDSMIDMTYESWKMKMGTDSVVITPAGLNLHGGEVVAKFVKIGTHCAVVMNANADTLWLAADTSGF